MPRWRPSAGSTGLLSAEVSAEGSADLATVAGGLGHLVHLAGVPVTPERSARLASSILLARPASVDELYWLARVTLVSTPADIATFDRVFRQLFGGLWDPADSRGDQNAPPPASAHGSDALARAGDDRPEGRPSAPRPTLVGDSTSDGGDDDRTESILAAFSPDERLRQQEFASISAAELVELRALMSRLALAPPPRRSRRAARHHRGAQVDLRSSLRRALRSGGDPVDLVRRRHRTRRRRLVILCDISGSMEAYARAYLQLLHSAVGGSRAEAFVFATRLTRVTKVLRASNPDHALYRAGQLAPDWSGGTRIGRGIKAFNDGYGRRGLARGAVVMIVSDGWERDDPELLGREMERLHRLAHRVIWVNPRKAARGYAPSVGGMAAALPHVDRFVSGHSLAAVDELLEAIADDGRG
ncbi:MAG: hypothetical protein JWM12_1884 [Ilumatobacteraceae bacterium]|nr:hypothetical protein [Ilumatobacteraceae bacterium]